MVRRAGRLALLALAVPCVCGADPAQDTAVACRADALLGEISARVDEEPGTHDIGAPPAGEADLYKRFISSQDGPNCTFQLSCSAYAKQALKKKGFLAGSLLAADRLLRCHGLGPAQYPVDSTSGRFVDPVP